MKKLALFLALCMVFTLALAGCNQATDPDTGDQTQDDTTTPSDTNDTTQTGSTRTDLHLALSEVPSVLDPHYANMIVEQHIIAQIYEPLIFVEDDGTERPMLATDYTVSEDGLVYTFNLRQGVLFQNGEELKASDVVFTVNRCKESASMYSYVEPIESVEAIDDYTVAITLGYQYAPFIQYVAGLLIVNEKFVNETGDDAMATNTCGTGPYMLKDFQQALSVAITAYPDYWQGEASIKDVDWKIITDTSTVLVAFEAGELDYTSVPSANWTEIESSGKYNTELLETSLTTYIMLNHTVAPFDNKLVRQAMSHAMNRDDMCLMGMDGLATPAYTMARPAQVFGATEDCTKFEYDVEKAKALLAEAGYPDGFDGGPIKTLSGSFQKIAQVAQSNLAAVGITTTVEMAETSAYVTDCANGNFGIAVMGVTLGTDYAMFDQIYATQFIDNLNMARYSNPEVDELFAQGVATVDKDERLDIYSRVIEIVQEDAVYIPIFFRQNPVAYNKDLNAKFYLSTQFYYEWSWN